MTEKSDLSKKDNFGSAFPLVRKRTAANGLPVYQYSYIALPETHKGVVAQDFLLLTLEAVVEMPVGYLGVDTEMQGLELRRID